jgi:hypothetical protein
VSRLNISTSILVVVIDSGGVGSSDKKGRRGVAITADLHDSPDSVTDTNFQIDQRIYASSFAAYT